MVSEEAEGEELWGKGSNRADKHFATVLWRDAWERCVFDYPPIEKLHDVKRGSDNARVFAQAVCLGNWDISLL
jgi:hypothetical protein